MVAAALRCCFSSVSRTDAACLPAAERNSCPVSLKHPACAVLSPLQAVADRWFNFFDKTSEDVSLFLG
jgi:hypothetical protein